MRGKHTLLMFLLWVVANNAPLPAEDKNSGWTSLRELENKKIEVLLLGGQSMQGTLADVTDSFLLLRSNEKFDRLDRSEVQRVSRIQKSTRARNTFLGMGIGIAAAELLGILVSGGDIKLKPVGVLGLAAVGGVAGSGIGLLTSSPESRTILYERP